MLKLFKPTGILPAACVFFLASCSMQQQIGKLAGKDLINDSLLKSAHIGISLYDPAANSYLYNYQGDKYFTPASNTKLFPLYAGMKYLGDSLVGIRYIERGNDLLVLPSGDPSLLHPDYAAQPVIDFLKKKKRSIYIADANWKEEALGAGWSWDDYNDDYLIERSALPVYGNFIRWVQEKQAPQKQDEDFASTPIVYSIPEVNWKVKFTADTSSKHFFVKRQRDQNLFEITQGNEQRKTQDVPFVTNGLASAIELLKDTVGNEISILKGLPSGSNELRILHSRPADSVFIPMMHRSDNFFAEQTLLMVSNEKLGLMNDELIIDTLLGTDLRGLPQKPNWADGSGLSRFNLFTPQDFIWLLNTMKNEFGLDRLKKILPTGGTGTLTKYYKEDSGYIFAKTGSLNGVICLSGYLYTQKNRLLIFSVLVNNHQAGTAVRRQIEKFIQAIRRKY